MSRGPYRRRQPRDEPAQWPAEFQCPSPRCGSRASDVIESRGVPDGSRIRRRRRCHACGTAFTSYERIDFARISEADARAILEDAEAALDQHESSSKTAA